MGHMSIVNEWKGVLLLCLEVRGVLLVKRTPFDDNNITVSKTRVAWEIVHNCFTHTT